LLRARAWRRRADKDTSAAAAATVQVRVSTSGHCARCGAADASRRSATPAAAVVRPGGRRVGAAVAAGRWMRGWRSAPPIVLGCLHSARHVAVDVGVPLATRVEVRPRPSCRRRSVASHTAPPPPARLAESGTCRSRGGRFCPKWLSLLSGASAVAVDGASTTPVCLLGGARKQQSTLERRGRKPHHHQWMEGIPVAGGWASASAVEPLGDPVSTIDPPTGRVRGSVSTGKLSTLVGHLPVGPVATRRHG